MIEPNTTCVSMANVLTSDTVEQNDDISEESEEEFADELTQISSDVSNTASELNQIKLKSTYRQKYKVEWECEFQLKGESSRTAIFHHVIRAVVKK